jgi:hypothetical protein
VNTREDPLKRQNGVAIPDAFDRPLKKLFSRKIAGRQRLASGIGGDLTGAGKDL